MLAEAAGKERLGAKCYCSARLYKNTKIKIWHLGVVCLRVCRQSRGWSLVKYAHTVTYKIIILTVNKATVRASAPQSYNWKRRELNSSFIIQMSLSSVRPINTSLPVPFLNPLSFFTLSFFPPHSVWLLITKSAGMLCLFLVAKGTSLSSRVVWFPLQRSMTCLIESHFSCK